MKIPVFILLGLVLLQACGKTKTADDVVQKDTDTVKVELSAPAKIVNPVKDTPAAHEYRAYKGALDENLPFNMHLVWDKGELSGWYDYQRFGRPIELEGKRLDDGRVMLSEIDPQIVESAKQSFFLGNFRGDEISGKWENAEGNTTFQFELQRDFSEENAQPELKSIQKVFGNCEKDSCIEISLTYPVLDEKWGKMFNDSMRVLMLQQLEAKAGSIDEAVQKMGDEFLEMLQEDDAGFVHWQTNASTEILYNSHGIFSVKMDMYAYTGGAHGQPHSVYLTYDLAKKRFIKLSDLFKPGYEETLRQQLILALKLQYGKSASATFESLGYYVSESEFRANDNFFVCPAGIGFQYTPYEIGPYVIGFQEAFVNFKTMGKYLKQDGLFGGR